MKSLFFLPRFFNSQHLTNFKFGKKLVSQELKEFQKCAIYTYSTIYKYLISKVNLSAHICRCTGYCEATRTSRIQMSWKIRSCRPCILQNRLLVHSNLKYMPIQNKQTKEFFIWIKILTGTGTYSLSWRSLKLGSTLMEFIKVRIDPRLGSTQDRCV